MPISGTIINITIRLSLIGIYQHLPRETEFRADVQTLRIFQELHGHRCRGQGAPDFNDAGLLRTRQNRDLLDQANVGSHVQDSDAAVQFRWRDVECDQRESLEQRCMQRFESGALNRVVHQLVSLIVYDLMRSDVRRVAASLTILMRDRPPLPGGARILLVLERPVEARRDRRHVERAYRRAGNSIAKNIHASRL